MDREDDDRYVVFARQGDSGEDVIYIISDDNFRARQRTLLLMFALGRQ